MNVAKEDECGQCGQNVGDVVLFVGGTSGEFHLDADDEHRLVRVCHTIDTGAHLHLDRIETEP